MDFQLKVTESHLPLPSPSPSTGNLSQSNNQCKGNGGCLIPESTTLERINYIPNPSIKCQFICKPKKCPNFIICQAKLPEWVLSCNYGLCNQCANSYGRLNIIEKEICSVCHQKTLKYYIKMKNCPHTLCNACYFYAYYGKNEEIDDEDGGGGSNPPAPPTSTFVTATSGTKGGSAKLKEPKFPYPQDVEDEYYDDQDNPKWTNDEKIQQYLIDWSKWDELREKQYADGFEDYYKHLETIWNAKRVAAAPKKAEVRKQKSGGKSATGGQIEDDNIGDRDEYEAGLQGTCPICKM